MDTRTKKIGLSGLGFLVAALVLLTVPVKAGTGLTVTSGASSDTSNGWTTPSNAYSTTDDNSYATAAPNKNKSTSGDWGGYGFGSSVPDQATITKVEIIPQYKVSTTASVASIDVQAIVNGTSCPSTALSQATEPTTDTEFIADVTSCRTWSKSDLLDGTFFARITAVRGNTNTGVTFSLDYVKIRITYSVPDYSQAAWRVFQNTDSTDVGTAYGSLNTPTSIPSTNSPFRVRMVNVVTTASLPAGTEQFKLQFAGKGTGSCAAPNGSPSSYTDVTSSTAISFYNNPTPTTDTALTGNILDPTNGADIIVDQTYVESNPFSAATNIAANSDGMWDFSLQDNNAPSSTTYCLRIVRNTGTALESYLSYPTVTTAAGILTADIVDGAGASVSSPSTALTSINSPFNCVTSTGTLGSSSQKIRIYNTLSTTGWTVSVAPTAGSSALWSAGSSLKYDFNDPSSSGCSDGTDSDSYAGQLSIDASSASITPQSGCGASGVSNGSNTAFSDGLVNSVTIASGTTSSRGCYWDITGIIVSQTIPAYQEPGTYGLNLTMTILAN